jgi:hypothetical protein
MRGSGCCPVLGTWLSGVEIFEEDCLTIDRGMFPIIPSSGDVCI